VVWPLLDVGCGSAKDTAEAARDFKLSVDQGSSQAQRRFQQVDSE
jgi:hypothetical protein